MIREPVAKGYCQYGWQWMVPSTTWPKKVKLWNFDHEIMEI
jgi:hypothetical protein